MDFDSHTEDGSPPAGSPKRTKRVTAEHTLERVRNNQRRHRARRREYITTLEEKLEKSEQALAEARSEIARLKADLVQCIESAKRSPQPLVSELPATTSYTSEDMAVVPYKGLDALSDAALVAQNMMAHVLNPHVDSHPSPPITSDALGMAAASSVPPVSTYCSSDTATAIDSSSGLPTPPREKPSGCCAGNAAASAVVPFTNTESGPRLSTTMPCLLGPQCCSHDLPTNFVPAEGMFDFEFAATLLTQPPPPTLPVDMLQSAMQTYYKDRMDDEPWTTCAEAFVLISQQNYKGVDPGLIEKWLRDGFAKARRPGEPCRVKNTQLISLLAFISEV